jgi:hypothetical protein
LRLRRVGSVGHILCHFLSLPTSPAGALTFGLGAKALLKNIPACFEPLTTTRAALLAHGVPPQLGPQGDWS